MTKPSSLLGLYSLPIKGPDDLKLVERSDWALSARDSELSVDTRELSTLRELITKCIDRNIPATCLDSFCYSYQIPYTGTEVDLVKVSSREVLCVELKSEMADSNRIESQLRKDRYYLSALSKSVSLFTYVLGGDVFTLRGDSLISSTLDALLDKMKDLSTDPVELDYDNLFEPEDFLVSPTGTPERFMADNYFLIESQRNFEQAILEDASNGDSCGKTLYVIKGSAGTGKTLLLYDLAKKIGSSERPAYVISCAPSLLEGHIWINENMPALRIMIPKDAMLWSFENASAIFFDETQRIYPQQFDVLVQKARALSIPVIVGIDQRQTLAQHEVQNNMLGHIEAEYCVKEYELKKKVRTNRRLASFIKGLFNCKQRKGVISRDVAEIVYAENVQIAELLLEQYVNRGYTFIPFSSSLYKFSELDRFDKRKYLNTHRVIGQEFNYVVMVLPPVFFYEESSGALGASVHPYSNYIYYRLLFEGVTRARKKIALIALNDLSFYKALVSIFTE